MVSIAQGMPVKKEYPPMSVLLAVGITSLSGGTMVAQMLAEAMYGDFNFYYSLFISICLGLGLLKGYEIARAWLMFLSGIACFAGVIGLIIGVGGLISPGQLEGVKTMDILKGFAAFVFVGAAFWGARTAETRSWCAPSRSAIDTRAAVKILTIFLALGTAVALPGEVSEQRKNAAFPVYSKIDFQTGSNSAVDWRFTFYGIKAYEGKKYPAVGVSFHQMNEPHPFVILEGVAHGPFQVEFGAQGYQKGECTISNGSPKAIVLTLEPEKQPKRTER